MEEAEDDVVDFVRKVPDRSRLIWQKLMVFKWIINLWAVGVPWSIGLFINFSWNLYVNIIWNKWWAEGNVFLIGNTLYIWFQSMVTIPLMFEIPPILRFVKPFRILSLLSAITYNILFVGTVIDFFYFAQVEEKDLLEE